MSGGPGFSVDLGTLSSAAAGIIAVLAQLDVRHVSDINCDPMSFGHDRLAGTTKDFGDRWETGVKNLAEDGRQLADRLVQTATSYGQADADARRALTSAAPDGEAADAAV